MSTKIFISWSRDLSNKLAEEVRKWLPGVLQFAKPYFTPSDIEKGSRWGNDISTELDCSEVGIICLTKDNLQKPWILFESGALSKNIEKSNVCTLLFNVESTDLTGPLTIFQNTKFEKEDFKKLVQTINNNGGDAKLEETVLDDVYDMWWPKLEEKVQKILDAEKNSGDASHRSDRELIEEILELSRLNSRNKNRKTSQKLELAVVDLVKCTGELAYSFENEEFDSADATISRLERVVNSICKHTDLEDLYLQYRSGMSLRRSLLNSASTESPF